MSLICRASGQDRNSPVNLLTLSGRLSYQCYWAYPCLLGFWRWDRGALPPPQFLSKNSLSHATLSGYYGKCNVLHMITCYDVLGPLRGTSLAKIWQSSPQLSCASKRRARGRSMYCISSCNWISWNECRQDLTGTELICVCLCQKVTREGARATHSLHDLFRIHSCENREDAQKVPTWLNWCGC